MRLVDLTRLNELPLCTLQCLIGRISRSEQSLPEPDQPHSHRQEISMPNVKNDESKVDKGTECGFRIS
jgi:hypothetical protein